MLRSRCRLTAGCERPENYRELGDVDRPSVSAVSFTLRDVRVCRYGGRSCRDRPARARRRAVQHHDPGRRLRRPGGRLLEGANADPKGAHRGRRGPVGVDCGSRHRAAELTTYNAEHAKHVVEHKSKQDSACCVLCVDRRYPRAHAGTVPELPFRTTMNARTRAFAFASADPNVECSAPVCSKNVDPAGTICSGP